MKNEDDQSLFAWGYPGYRHTMLPGPMCGAAVSCFANSPADFARCSQVRPWPVGASHYVITNKGLQIEMAVRRLLTGDYIGRLNCTLKAADSNGWTIVIPLVRLIGSMNVFYRPEDLVPERVPVEFFEGIKPQHIYISRSIPALVPWKAGIRLSSNFLRDIEVKEIHPPNWDLRRGLCLVHESSTGAEIGGEQSIILLLDCLTKQAAHFVLQIEYSFKLNRFGSQPTAARVSAAASHTPWERYPSLLQLMVSKHNDHDESMLDWQEDFVYEPMEGDHSHGSAADGFQNYFPNNHSRRICCNPSKQSGPEWKIGVRYEGIQPFITAIKSSIQRTPSFGQDTPT